MRQFIIMCTSIMVFSVCAPIYGQIESEYSQDLISAIDWNEKNMGYHGHERIINAASVQSKKDLVQVSVSPNPTTDLLNFSFSEDTVLNEVSMNLYSASGQLVKEASNNSSLSISDLKGGMYQLVIYEGSDEVSTHHIMKL